MELNIVINKDCLRVFPDISSNSIPLVICDPPYYSAVKELLPDEIVTLEDYLVWYEKWIKEVSRVLTEDGSFYVFVPPLEYAEVNILIKKYFCQKQVISWVKLNVMIRQPTARNFLPKTEFVGFYVKDLKNYTWNRLMKKYGLQQSCNFAIVPTVYKGRGEGVGHPTQKPLKLCAKLIYASSNEGDIVLDPFCGSGTTLVAAKALGRKFIGIDVKSEYCKLSRARVGQFLIEDLEDKPKNAIF